MKIFSQGQILQTLHALIVYVTQAMHFTILVNGEGAF